jgi:hypothetical protein
VTSFAFDRATAIRDLADATQPTYAIEVDPEWTIDGKPNGGYLLATLARAALQSVAEADDVEATAEAVLAASAHYVRAPRAGPADVVCEVLRPGRLATQVRARLRQAGRTCVESVLTLGRLPTAGAGMSLWSGGVSPLTLPPEDTCVRLPAEVPGRGFRIAILDQVELRVDPAVAGFSRGQPGGGGEIRAWVRFADGRSFDPLSVLFALDVLPPATLELGTSGWAPTLELTCYVRAAPAPGPLLVRQRTGLLAGALFDETCDVWDSEGQLVGQATQLAAVRFS